ALAAFLGPSLTNAMIAIGVSATPIFARLTRAAVIHVKVEDYIEAARALGASPRRQALRHVLPNIAAPLLVQATLAIAAAGIAETCLGTRVIGRRAPAPSCGSVRNAAKHLGDRRPCMAVWPGRSVFLEVPRFNVHEDRGPRPDRHPG